MQDFMQFLKKNAILLTVILAVSAFALLVPMIEYSNAMFRVKNYQYQMAEKRFLSMGDYRDSEEMAEEMARLTEMTMVQVRRLLLLSEDDAEATGRRTFRCVDAGFGIEIGLNPDIGFDQYVQWGSDAMVMTDSDAKSNFFGPDSEQRTLGLVRYDEQTGEYLFIRCFVNSDITSTKKSVILYRGKLNEDGTLELYNDQGERYVFK